VDVAASRRKWRMRSSVDGWLDRYPTLEEAPNNKVDVFDSSFSKPLGMQGKFMDPGIPAGFVPFGIAAVNQQLYVTYAMQDSAKHDEVTGAERRRGQARHHAVLYRRICRSDGRSLRDHHGGHLILHVKPLLKD
jgi:hypothetical protein